MNDQNNFCKKRYFKCCLCQSNKLSKSVNHSLRQCNKFKLFKHNISQDNYFLHNVTALKESDEKGFCASGIIPYCIKNGEIYIMLLIEKRNSIIGLNFIAGGRECIEFINLDKNGKNSIYPETSFETALNETDEELGDILISESLELIMSELKLLQKNEGGNQNSLNYRLPADVTLKHAAKLAIVEDKPIMMDYWAASLDKKALIGA